MILDHEPPRTGQPYPGPAYPGQPRSALYRFLGGSPGAVFVKLLFLSILVGAGMAMLGLTPGALFRHAYDTLRALLDLGLDAFQDFGGWIVAGALVVVPIWLIARLLAVSK
jgi:hypothetical protein